MLKSTRRITTGLAALLIGVAQAVAQEFILKGTVSDPQGDPLTGATVQVVNTPKAVAADIDGNFAIGVNPGQYVKIHYVGFKPTDITANAANNPIKITLEEDAANLEEVVVIGYGSVHKKDLTGAVVQVHPEKLADQNPGTVADLLRGTAGLQVGYDTSAKGGGSLLIRGVNSVGTSSSPLIILDGMIFYGELSEINPDDIAQIDVLKDASAAAVYGASAAGGVILITTNKGKMGKPVITVSGNWGFSRRTGYRKLYGPDNWMANREVYYKDQTYGVNPETGAYEYYQLRDKDGKLVYPTGYFDHFNNIGKYGIDLDTWLGYTTNTDMTPEEVYARRLNLHEAEGALANYLAGRTYDWASDGFRTGFNQDYNASVSGATERADYYVSFGYLKNEGVVRGDDYHAARVSMKINTEVTPWLRLGAQANFQDRSDDSDPADWGRIQANSPYSPKYHEDGSLVQYPLSEANHRGYNYDFEKQWWKHESGYTVLNSIFTAKVTLPFGITYNFNISPRYQWYHNRYWSSASEPDANPQYRGVDRNWGKHFDWNLNNIITWDYTFNRQHHVTATFVQEAEERKWWSDNIYARNILPTDALGFHNTQNGTKVDSSFDTNDSHSSGNALMGHLFYSFNDTYMITGTFRRDGYSAFGLNHPYAYFPSVALGWRFTQEKFWKWGWLDDGKLRLSWGKNGNRNIGEYVALANLGSGTGATMGYLDANGGELIDMKYLSYDRLANPDLEWEKTKSYNVGLDLSFLNSRITTNIDFYIKKTNDMIMAKRLPAFTGFGSITTNLGEVENKGIEITLNTINMDLPKFRWNTTLTFSYNKNTINHLYYEYEDVLDDAGNAIGKKEMDDTSNGWFIGHAIGEIWDFKYDGIWQADQVEEAARYGQRPGDPRVANIYTADDVVNSDGTTTPVYNDKDKVFLGQSRAPIFWQLRNEFTLWKDLDISFSMYARMGHKSLSTDYLNHVNKANEFTYCLNRVERNYWTPENRSEKYGRWEAVGPKGCTSPSRVFNRDFIRLDNISVGYTLPTRWTKKAMIERCRISANINNVATWKKDWPYGDPETGGIAKRTFSLGLKLTL